MSRFWRINLSDWLQIAATLKNKKHQPQCNQKASLIGKLKLLELQDLISLEKLSHNILRNLLQLRSYIFIHRTVSTVGVSHG